MKLENSIVRPLVKLFVEKKYFQYSKNPLNITVCRIGSKLGSGLYKILSTIYNTRFSISNEVINWHQHTSDEQGKRKKFFSSSSTC